MERDQWYKPNLLYNIHYRPQKQQDPQKMIVETRVFNPSVCTCGKHGCDPHYRMERRVIWSSKAEEDTRKMKREASKQDPEDGHSNNIGKEDESADGEKEVANVSVKSAIGGIDEKCSGDIVNADGGKRNSFVCMENGNCGAGGGNRHSVDCMGNGDSDGNGMSGENEILNCSIDHESIGNSHGGRSCIGNGENSIGCGDDGFVDCIVGYGCIGNDPGDRTCIRNDGSGQMYRQLHADDYIKSTGPLHIISIAPPQLDSIPTEKANVNATDQLDEAEEQRITQEVEDTLKGYITENEAIQKERKRVENGITKRKSIGARIRGVLSNLFCCKSRRAVLVD